MEFYWSATVGTLNQDHFWAISGIFHFLGHVELPLSPPPLTQHGLVGQLNMEIFKFF